MLDRLVTAGQPPQGARAFSDRLARADGLVIVTPEYKGAYPGSLKNALDYLERQVFHRKPIGIVTVSSGRFGGISCLAQLRLVCLAMGGVPVPASLLVTNVNEAFDANGLPRDPTLSGRLATFLDELI